MPSTPAEGRCQQGRLANRPCAVRVIACPPEADAAICRIVLTVPARKIAASPIATLGLLAMTVPFSVIASSPEADAAICLAYCPDGGRDCRVAHRYARAPRNDGAPLMAVEIAASPFATLGLLAMTYRSCFVALRYARAPRDDVSLPSGRLLQFSPSA